ncbi:hypothetical protein ACFL2V_10325 [Pseudomonadota bacterium]
MERARAYCGILIGTLLLAGCGGGGGDGGTPAAPDTQEQTQTPDKVAKFSSRPDNSGCVAPDDAVDTAAMLSDTGCFTDTATQTVADGVIPYTVNSVLWSDGESKGRYFAIPDGSTIDLEVDESGIVDSNGIQNGDFDFPIGSVVIKNFYSGSRIVETRLLSNHANDGWVGYAYQWNVTQTDATLLTSFKEITSPVSHYFPSRQECMDCHTDGALVILGPDTLQLNYTLYYDDDTEENYLDALDRLGYFTASPLPAYKDNRLYAINDTSATLEQKSRSYLHSNCSGCHRTGAPQGGYGDMRYNSSFAANVCGVTASHEDSPVGGVLVDPGDADNSTVFQRISAPDSNAGLSENIKMPPVGRETVDDEAKGVIEAWINGLSACD